jgi:hypothetical protein
MIKGFVVSAVAAAFLAASGFVAPDAAFAKSDKAAKSQLQECKKISDPKAKDECVSNAKNAAQKGSAGEKAAKKGKAKAKDM